jgi:hypothetical protein
MSQFYATIQGSRSERTCQGTKNSGLWGHIRGWDIGAHVDVIHVGGEDIVKVNITRGSNGGGIERRLGSFKLKGEKIVKING